MGETDGVGTAEETGAEANRIGAVAPIVGAGKCSSAVSQARGGKAAATGAQRGGAATFGAQMGEAAASGAQREGATASRAQRGGAATSRAQRGRAAASRAQRGGAAASGAQRRVKSIPPPQPRPPPLESSLALLRPVPQPLLLDTLSVFLDLPVLDLEPRSLQHWPQLCPWLPAPLS
ncbi:UNVERIFIED_CONTAM: hypothetical protein FKN15_018999 [Acipenser sinensis]